MKPGALIRPIVRSVPLIFLVIQHDVLNLLWNDPLITATAVPLQLLSSILSIDLAITIFRDAHIQSSVL